jgi:hypothetical protein
MHISINEVFSDFFEPNCLGKSKRDLCVLLSANAYQNRFYSEGSYLGCANRSGIHSLKAQIPSDYEVDNSECSNTYLIRNKQESLN